MEVSERDIERWADKSPENKSSYNQYLYAKKQRNIAFLSGDGALSVGWAAKLGYLRRKIVDSIKGENDAK